MSPQNTTIAFIGAGNLASSIIRGLVAKGYPAKKIQASAPSAKHLTPLARDLSIVTSHDNTNTARSAAVLILAIKPQLMKTVCLEIADFVPRDTLVISLAAGVNCDSIAYWLGEHRAIVRCMANTPAQVMLGASGLFANHHVSAAQKQQTESIIHAVGIARWFESETQIDAVTALSGSGPAYIFLFLEAMIDAAESLGLDRESARALATQTALGAATLASDSDLSPAELRHKVTSPNGTTERAITVLEKHGAQKMIEAAMHAAAQRAEELAKENHEP